LTKLLKSKQKALYKMANELYTLNLNEKMAKKHHKWYFSSIFYAKYQKIPEKYQF